MSDNLDDESYDNPYDDARAHRAQLRGDMLVLGYTWTPTWHDPDNSHTTYDFFVRRSFDGGQSLTDVKGNPEAPRNVSNVPPSRSVFEPRIMATPKDITKSTGDPTGDPEDVRNEYIFYVSYGTEDISGRPRADPAQGYLLRPHHGFGRDVRNGHRCTMIGGTRSTMTRRKSGKWDRLARGGGFMGAEGAQIRMTPAGNSFYATWLQKEHDVNGNVTGSDIFFRKIEYPMAFVEGPEVSVRSQPLLYHITVDKPGNYDVPHRLEWRR